MEHAESPLGCEVHKARIGPTWDEYDFTNSRQRELVAPFLSAFPPVGADVPLPPGVVVVDVLFQNLTTLIIYIYETNIEEDEKTQICRQIILVEHIM